MSAAPAASHRSFITVRPRPRRRAVPRNPWISWRDHPGHTHNSRSGQRLVGKARWRAAATVGSAAVITRPDGRRSGGACQRSRPGGAAYELADRAGKRFWLVAHDERVAVGDLGEPRVGQERRQPPAVVRALAERGAQPAGLMQQPWQQEQVAHARRHESADQKWMI